jgi:hypothetical protein
MIIACKESGKEDKSAKEDKIETAEELSAPAVYFEEALVENLETKDEKTLLRAAYDLYRGLSKENEMDTLSYSNFEGYYKFTYVKEISDKQIIVVLGMEYEESRFELFLLNKKEASIWELKTFEGIDTRYVIQTSDVKYDSINKLLHLVVEQAWSSEGDLAAELFYQITEDTMRQVLERSASGGEEVDVAVRSQDGCNMELVVNFRSDLDKVSKNELQFLYQYELLLYSSCDGTIENKDTILQQTDRISYLYNAKKELYTPNWKSLKELNQDQFEAMTNWGDLDPFAFEIRNYCQKIENTMPKSSKMLRAAFTEN